VALPRLSCPCFDRVRIGLPKGGSVGSEA
jgi:hypothetical protein